MANPNIQIDDLVREMTDEEYAAFMVENPDYVAAKAPTTKTTKTTA
jgi:tRNA A37 threonylcarbamoyladenosine dehydratase